MDLPAGWAQATDPSSGRVYYYSGSEVSWTFPGKAPPPLASQPAPQQAWAPPQPGAAPPQAWAQQPPVGPYYQGAPAPSIARPVTTVTIHTASASKHASKHAGFVALCGCCGGDYVEVEVDEERVSTVREERPCCSSQCCDFAQKAESVEFEHLQSIRGEQGWVPNFSLITLGMVAGVFRALLLLCIAGLRSPTLSRCISGSAPFPPKTAPPSTHPPTHPPSPSAPPSLPPLPPPSPPPQPQ